MDELTRERIVDRLHGNPELTGVPFEVAEDDDGLHLELDGEVLATVPDDRDERASARAELKRRYGIALPAPDELEDATPEALEKWLFYAAGFKDSLDPIVEWETRQYEARLPHLAAVVRERLRARLASPLDGPDDVGARIVEALGFSVERVTHTRESEWSGVPVELESSGYYLVVSVDLEWVDDALLRHRLDSQLRSLTDDGRADAERRVSPELIKLLAEALTARWSEETATHAADRVEETLAAYGEAFVSRDPDGPAPGERPFREAMEWLSGELSIEHAVSIDPETAYYRAEADA